MNVRNLFATLVISVVASLLIVHLFVHPLVGVGPYQVLDSRSTGYCDGGTVLVSINPNLPPVCVPVASPNVSWLDQDPTTLPTQSTFDFLCEASQCNSTWGNAWFTTSAMGASSGGCSNHLSDGGVAPYCNVCSCPAANAVNNEAGWDAPGFATQTPSTLAAGFRWDVVVQGDGTWSTPGATKEWIGLFAQSFSSGGCTTERQSDAPSRNCSVAYVGLRCSPTGADGGPDGTWQWCMGNGSADSCTTTGVTCPPAYLPEHEYDIDCSAHTSCSAGIDGVFSVVGATTDIPSLTTQLGVTAVALAASDGGTVAKLGICQSRFREN